MKNANKILIEISEVRRRRTSDIMGDRLWAGLMGQLAGFVDTGRTLLGTFSLAERVAVSQEGLFRLDQY
jgi:hypothetical protein